MNETIALNPRQKAIINLLGTQEALSREHIGNQLLPLYPTSKATLARDLAELAELGLLVLEGNGPATTYRIKTNHKLLKPVDMPTYFTQEPDDRSSVQIGFDIEVLDQLNQPLLGEVEQGTLTGDYRSFSQSLSNIDPTIAERELERFLIELAWKSSRIEGNRYTVFEVETLLKHSQMAPGKTKEEALMILNHKAAFKLIYESREQFRSLSASVISQLHNVLVQDLSITSGIRKHAVGITGTNYRPLDNEWQLRDALEKMIEVVNNTEDPLGKGLIVAAIIPYLQPFTDGNKRTARMLANAVLMAHDFFPLSYRSVDENEYKQALILFYETHNLFHVKRLFVEQYQHALKTYFVS
jgi:Fic family protein